MPVLHNWQLHLSNKLLFGKLTTGDTCCQHVSSISPSAKVLYLTDKSSDVRYLVDTGACLSVTPPLKVDMPHKGKGKSLKAANGSEIKTYGERAVQVDFG